MAPFQSWYDKVMRQVNLRKNGHQVHIVTTRRDLAVVEVAVRMFHRWRQENFFKYMGEEFNFGTDGKWTSPGRACKGRRHQKPS